MKPSALRVTFRLTVGALAVCAVLAGAWPTAASYKM